MRRSAKGLSSVEGTVFVLDLKVIECIAMEIRIDVYGARKTAQKTGIARSMQYANIATPVNVTTVGNTPMVVQ